MLVDGRIVGRQRLGPLEQLLGFGQSILREPPFSFSLVFLRRLSRSTMNASLRRPHHQLSVVRFIFTSPTRVCLFVCFFVSARLKGRSKSEGFGSPFA